MSEQVGQNGAHAVGKALVVTQWVLLVGLLALAPFAMRFTPFEGIYEHGVWGAHHAADSLYTQRAGLVLFGLVASAADVFCFTAVVALQRCRQYAIVSFGLTLAALVLGWRMYPYWATGVFSVMRGALPRTDLDPKALMPMSWTGELWRLPILLLDTISIIGIPTLLVFAAIALFRKAWTKAAALAFCVGVTVVAYCFSPNYWDWLLD